MSPQNESNSLMTIANLEKEVGEYAASISTDLTPYSVMEYLKKDSGDDDLTILGKLIRDYLHDPELLQYIGWVVFHFAFPHRHFDRDESATRNWIAINKSQQDLVNCVHDETISGEEGRERITKIYAPSIVANILDASNSSNSENFLKKWWVYNLSPCVSDCRTQHQKCLQSIPKSSDIICFSKSSSEVITILSCFEDGEKPLNPATLGILLDNADEGAVADSFDAFAELIRHRDSARNYTGDTLIKSTHYSRLPFFFQNKFHKRKYRTEAYIAFDAPDIETVANILHQLEPLLRLCVTIVNSHIAYISGEEAGEEEGELQERLKAAARVSHAMSTPLRSVAALVNKMPSTVVQKKAIEYQVASCRNLEKFVREIVKRWSSGRESDNLLRGGTAEEFINDFKSQLQTLCSIFEDQEASIAGNVVEILTKEKDDLFSTIGENLFFPSEHKMAFIKWNTDQLYVIADGLLANALKYHALKFGARALSTYESMKTIPHLDLKFEIKHMEKSRQKLGVFLIIENDSYFENTKFFEAEKLAEDLSECNQVDWIGVSLLHIASEAMGYDTPSWEVIDSKPFVRMRAIGQIGCIEN